MPAGTLPTLTDAVEKPFGGNKRNFLKLLMRFARNDVRDHIASQKNDRGPSYRLTGVGGSNGRVVKPTRWTPTG